MELSLLFGYLQQRKEMRMEGNNVKKILIIDDEPALRQTLGAILKREGYTPFMVGTGHEGISKLCEEHFSLVFLDIKLPDGTGTDLLPQIHQIQPDVPVIILTAHATLETAMQAVKGGARDFLLKPIDPHAILERVSQILQEAQEPLRQREIISQLCDLVAELGSPDPAELKAKKSLTSPEEPKSDRFLDCGDMKADLHTRHIFIANEAVSLPSTSFDYLVTLMRHSPDPVSFEVLVNESQGFNYTKNEARDITRWHIHQIRKMIEKDPSYPQHLITVRDVGYRLVA